MKIILPSYDDLKAHNSFYTNGVSITENDFVSLLKTLNPSVSDKKAHGLFNIINTDITTQHPDADLQPQKNTQVIDKSEWEKFWNFSSVQSHSKAQCPSCDGNTSKAVDVDDASISNFYIAQVKSFDRDANLQVETGNTSVDYEKAKQDYIKAAGQSSF